MNNYIDEKFNEIKHQICELDDRIAFLENKEQGIIIYDALILLNSADLEKNLASLMNHIRTLTKRVGKIQIVISDE